MGTKRFIVIAGNIGSGKTTLTHLLSERFDWAPHFEAVKENPYLEDFYTDMNRWSLPLQIYFLSKRFQAHQRILEASHSAIQDRSIYEDAHIFARALHDSGIMDKRDYENYQELHRTMIQYLTPPDLVVYLRRSVPSLQERIKERGRDYEKNISEKYLHQLNDCYDSWIDNYKLGKVLMIEGSDLDIKNDPEDLTYVCNQILASIEQPDLFFRA